MREDDISQDIDSKIQHIWRAVAADIKVMAQLQNDIRATRNFREDEFDALIQQAMERTVRRMDAYVDVRTCRYQAQQWYCEIQPELEVVTDEGRHVKMLRERKEVADAVSRHDQEKNKKSPGNL